VLMPPCSDKKVRQAAAQNEPAWTNAGKTIGLEIWRIEKFQVKSWPKDQYGKFFSGDCYIILNTYQEKDSPKIKWDVHFWIGEDSTQDEYGTAAYKTVELDDLLGTEPVQHREVMGHESKLFLSYFKQIEILKGGVESGFRRVTPELYRTRLLHFKGKKNVVMREVPLERASLNSGDVFIVDAGLKLFQFNGKQSSGIERQKAAAVVRAIDDERRGNSKIVVVEEGDNDDNAKTFWAFFGGFGPIKTKEEGGADDEAPKSDKKRLFRLSDASGQMTFSECKFARRSELDPNDVFILDGGFEVFVWIGRGASKEERKNAMSYATQYLTKENRPKFLPITRILQGGENETFEECLNYSV
jgi:gelsolin